MAKLGLFFVYLRLFHNTMTNIVQKTINGKSTDGGLGIWTRECWMEGADESIEFNYFIILIIGTPIFNNPYFSLGNIILLSQPSLFCSFFIDFSRSIVVNVSLFPVWTDFAKFRHFGKNLQVFGKFWRFISYLAK